MTGLELLSALAKSGTGAEKLRIVGAECGPHTTADEVVGRFQALGHRGTVEKATVILAEEAVRKSADDKPGKKDKTAPKPDPSDKADDSAAGEKDKAGSKSADDKPGDKPPAQ